MIKLILITAISTGAAFLMVRLLSSMKSRQQGHMQNGDQKKDNKSRHQQRPGLIAFLLVGIICAVMVVYVLPRFGISVMGLAQKLLAFGPLIRTFLPF